MPITLEVLDQRLAVLERQVAVLERELQPTHSPGGNGADIPLFREADRQRPAVRKAAEETLRKLGINVKPVGAEKLQALMLAAGVKPEENMGSREILAMRGE